MREENIGDRIKHSVLYRERSTGIDREIYDGERTIKSVGYAYNSNGGNNNTSFYR